MTKNKLIKKLFNIIKKLNKNDKDLLNIESIEIIKKPKEKSWVFRFWYKSWDEYKK